MISRRTLVKALLATGAVTTTTLIFLPDDDPEISLITAYDYSNLSPEQALIISTFLLAILDGLPIQQEQELLQCVITVDQTLSYLPEQQKNEFMELLDLLSNRFGALVLTRGWINWSEVTVAAIDEVLSEWSNSSIGLLNVAYDGMKKLLIASWYGNDKHWHMIQYPGPPELI